MAVDKSLVSGSTSMLILRLLEEKDMYGYEMIERLRRKSGNVFELKAGTLYPLLHGMESKGLLRGYTLMDEGCPPEPHALRSEAEDVQSDRDGERIEETCGGRRKKEAGKMRKYYSITKNGRRALEEKKEEWFAYSRAVVDVLNMGGAL